MANAPDLAFIGGECLTRLGTLSQRTAQWEDEAETHTRSSEAFLIERDGVLKTADANIPRIEWVDDDSDGVRETPVLLLEAARTNGWTFSEQLDNAAWTKFQATISANATTAPDGVITADKLVEDGTDNEHKVFRATPALTNDTVQPFSFFAKAAERIWVVAETIDKANSTKRTWINLSTGVLGTTAAGHSVTIENVGKNWYRIKVEWDSGTGATAPRGTVLLADADNSFSYQGDNSSGVYMWGMQFETDQPFVSSYIQTAGATATRTADTIYSDFLWVPQGLTVYLKFIESGSIDVDGGAILNIGAGNGNAPYLRVLQQNTPGYRGLHNNNSTSEQSLYSAVVPSIDDTVELRVTLTSAGLVNLFQSINSGAEAAGNTPSANELASAWSDTRVYLNGHDPSFGKYKALKIHRGIRSLVFMRAL